MDLEIFHQIIIGLVCNFLTIDCGLHEGWPTPTIGKFGVEDSITLTSDQEAMVINLMYVGVALGTLAPLVLMDRIGRKGTLLVAAVPKICSWIAIGLADSQLTLCFARILAGIGCGITYSVLPMYIGEVSSKRTRGTLGAMIVVLINTGLLLIYTIGVVLSRFEMAMISLACPLLFIITSVWLPESSVHLIRKNRPDLAEKSLKWSLGKDNVSEEFDELRKIVETEDEIMKIGLIESLKKIFKSPSDKRACWIQFILMNGLSMTGAAPILSFQVHIFHEADFDVGADFTIVATGVALVLSGVVCMTVVRRFGKRKLLLVSGPLIFSSLAVIAIFFTLQSNGIDVKSVNWIPSAFVIIYIIIFGFAFNSLPLVYLGELFSAEVKAVAAVCTVLYYSAITIVSIKVYQELSDAYGTLAPMWILTVITFIIWCLICVFVPETEGKSLAEIQTMLSEGFVKSKVNGITSKPKETSPVDIEVYSLKKVNIAPTS